MKESFKHLLSSKLNVASLSIILIYITIAVLSKFNFIGGSWNIEVGKSYEAPNLINIFGTDIFGRSVFQKVVKGTEIAMSVGVVVSIISAVLGVFLGVLAGYFGGWIDDFLMWLYTVIASIPNIILLVSIAYILGKGIFAIFIALSSNFWTDIFLFVRNEVIRHRDREYVQAATALGAGHFRKIFYHILPNIMHVILIKFSMVFQQAIKSEVLLSYLGLGVQNTPSWGRMIDEAKIELMKGVWWQIFFATTFMFLIVLSFNILSDAIRVSLDPKMKK